MTKHCAKCGQDKPRDEFYLRWAHREARCHHCKECSRAVNRETRRRLRSVPAEQDTTSSLFRRWACG